MSNNNPNVCAFKKECRGCNKVALEDRPVMCAAIKCPIFEPCPNCHNNRTLHEVDGVKLCKKCFELSPNLLKKLMAQREAEISSGNLTMPPAGGAGSPRIITMSLPGIAPDGLEPYEKDYYNKRWEQYEGHYRNPSAYFTCHAIILEEIRANYLLRKRIDLRGEAEAENRVEYTSCMATLDVLTKRLPEKEAEDVMDDEKTLAVIYEKYSKETAKRRTAGVSRIFTNEAIVLDPALDFPVNPRAILERLGYKIASFTELLEKIVLDGDIKKKMGPKELLEFFGFRLDEEYALPFDHPGSDAEEVTAELGVSELDDDEEES